MQHDECKVGIGGSKRFAWDRQHRIVPHDAILQETVYERLALKQVLNYDTYEAYRPEPLRTHNIAKKFFNSDATNQA